MFKPNRFRDNEIDRFAGIQKPIMNYDIKHFKIRLINDLGENEGVFSVKEAIFKAKEKGLDLIEINPNANPPVCKIMDIGKYLFEEKKHKKETTNKTPENHEIRLTPGIGEHDLQIKAKKAEEFLKEGSKVTIQFKLRGREAKKIDIIRSVVDRFYNYLKEFGILESKNDSFILIPKQNI